MARILIFLFCAFALNTNRAGSYEGPSSLPPFITVTEEPAWETRNLGGWMISVMPYASVSFCSSTLSNVTGITLCLRAVTDKKWLLEDELRLTFGQKLAVYFQQNYISSPEYQLSVGGSKETFNKYSMVPVQEVRSLWKSRCLTWDSSSGMAQLWFDSMMSVRKGLSRGTVFSGQAELTMIAFEGQVSDVYLWDSVLSVRELHRYLYHHSVPSRGRVLDWTQMKFRTNGYVVCERAFPKQLPAGPAKRNEQKRLKSLKKCQRQEV